MTEVKFDTTKQDCCFTVEEYVTKDVVDEKIKNIDSKLQKKIKASSQSLERNISNESIRLISNMRNMSDNFNNQINAYNKKLESYIQKEKDVEYLKRVCKELFKLDYVEMVSNLDLRQNLKKMIIKKSIKNLKSLLREYWTIRFDEFEGYIEMFNPDDKAMVKHIVDAVDRIETYNQKYMEYKPYEV